MSNEALVVNRAKSNINNYGVVPSKVVASTLSDEAVIVWCLHDSLGKWECGNYIDFDLFDEWVMERVDNSEPPSYDWEYLPIIV